jgi:hypothetical protein
MYTGVSPHRIERPAIVTVTPSEWIVSAVAWTITCIDTQANAAVNNRPDATPDRFIIRKPFHPLRQSKMPANVQSVWPRAGHSKTFAIAQNSHVYAISVHASPRRMPPLPATSQ